MQESNLEEQKAHEAMTRLALSMKHEKVVAPLLSEIELAIKEKRPVLFSGYANSIAHRFQGAKPSQKELAQHAVSDLEESIAFHRDFSLWEEEKNGHEKTISDHKPSGRLGRLKERILGNYQVERARGRIKTIEGYRKARNESVERMAAACKHIRKNYL